MEVGNEKYLINKAKNTQLSDPYQSKSWIITAKTLYPNDFSVQFEAFNLEKNADNAENAANCFSYIIMTFFHQNNQIELWNEISKLTEALRVPEGLTTPEQEFYVKMFQHITYDVQHKILLLTANHSDNNFDQFDHCKLILLLLKRFPQAIATHAPRLLDTVIQGMATYPIQFREMLVLEVLPLIYIQKPPPDLPSHIVNRMMAISLEYYVNQMFQNTDDKKTAINENWKKIFEILELCGKMLNWEPFLPYNKNWSKDVYWQKLMQIVTNVPTRPSENKQILFCATILFILSLQEYINITKMKMNDMEIDFILVEGFRENILETTKRRKIDSSVIPQISVTSPCSNETANCFVTSSNCWQLLHSNEILQIDFTQLLNYLPLSDWVNRFLIDLSVYMGRSEEESATLLKETNTQGMMMTPLEINLRMLSLSRCQGGGITNRSLEYITACLRQITNIPIGALIKNLTITTQSKHLVLLPLTKKAVLQYCTTAFIEVLKPDILNNPNCSYMNMGNMLVLLQLDWPNGIILAEKIFDIIRARKSFRYQLFPNYIVNIDLIEEFMYMYMPHGGAISLELTQTNIGQRSRIGTRGQDKGFKEDFKQIIRQQIAKSNDIDSLIIQFITDEGPSLMSFLM